MEERIKETNGFEQTQRETINAKTLNNEAKWRAANEIYNKIRFYLGTGRIPSNFPSTKSNFIATAKKYKINKSPWKLSFSYGRALQEDALKMWAGKNENKDTVQNTFLHRAKMNSLACHGKWNASLENE